MAPRPHGQTLIFDADDTLWENNVFFERAIDAFTDWMAHPTLSPDEIRRVLAEVENANIVAHGYGSTVFLRSLTDCFTRLSSRPASDAELDEIARFGAALSSGHIELIPEVERTLAELGTRHRLLMMTKGAVEEQQRKIDASGLAHHFEAVHIVARKDPETYLKLVAESSLDPSSTWMIGNSPKSDIIAAREAGLRAVFVPNAATWDHEHAELDPGDGGILHVAAFGHLTAHF